MKPNRVMLAEFSNLNKFGRNAQSVMANRLKAKLG